MCFSLHSILVFFYLFSLFFLLLQMIVFQDFKINKYRKKRYETIAEDWTLHLNINANVCQQFCYSQWVTPGNSIVERCRAVVVTCIHVSLLWQQERDHWVSITECPLLEWRILFVAVLQVLKKFSTKGFSFLCQGTQKPIFGGFAKTSRPSCFLLLLFSFQRNAGVTWRKVFRAAKRRHLGGRLGCGSWGERAASGDSPISGGIVKGCGIIFTSGLNVWRCQQSGYQVYIPILLGIIKNYWKTDN